MKFYPISFMKKNIKRSRKKLTNSKTEDESSASGEPKEGNDVISEQIRLSKQLEDYTCEFERRAEQLNFTPNEKDLVILYIMNLHPRWKRLVEPLELTLNSWKEAAHLARHHCAKASAILGAKRQDSLDILRSPESMALLSAGYFVPESHPFVHRYPGAKAVKHLLQGYNDEDSPISSPSSTTSSPPSPTLSTHSPPPQPSSSSSNSSQRQKTPLSPPPPPSPLSPSSEPSINTSDVKKPEPSTITTATNTTTTSTTTTATKSKSPVKPSPTTSPSPSQKEAAAKELIINENNLNKTSANPNTVTSNTNTTTTTTPTTIDEPLEKPSEKLSDNKVSANDSNTNPEKANHSEKSLEKTMTTKPAPKAATKSSHKTSNSGKKSNKNSICYRLPKEHSGVNLGFLELTVHGKNVKALLSKIHWIVSAISFDCAKRLELDIESLKKKESVKTTVFSLEEPIGIVQFPIDGNDCNFPLYVLPMIYNGKVDVVLGSDFFFIFNSTLNIKARAIHYMDKEVPYSVSHL